MTFNNVDDFTFIYFVIECSGRLMLNFYKILQKHYLIVNLSKAGQKLADLSLVFLMGGLGIEMTLVNCLSSSH